MKRLIKDVICTVDREVHKDSVNLVKLENFDSPVIYMEICKFYSSNKELEFIATLEYEKYLFFKSKNNNDWEYALDYLNDNGFVQRIPLTKFRNLVAEKNGGTVLMILMGAESALDKGSLKDFTHISMNDIVEKLKKNYCSWFEEYLREIDCDHDKNKESINNIYKDLFKHINVDAMQLSCFIDSLDNQNISNIDDLVEYIYSTLKDYWNIPSIFSNFKKPVKTTQKYISNAYQFINNTLTLSSSKIKNLNKKLDKYANDNQIDETLPFHGFVHYQEFRECLDDFLHNKDIDSNRKKFMNMDFGIITKILDLTIDKESTPEPKDKVIKISGEPLCAYLELITHSIIKFKDKYGFVPQNIVISINSIRLSNCTTSDTDKEYTSIAYHFENICTYMGGILNYINSRGMKNSNIIVSYDDDIDPFDINNLDCIEPKIKAIDKMGENSEIKITTYSVGDDADEKVKTEFKWSFSPYANWKNAFSLLRLLSNPDESYEVASEAPLLTTCSNMDDLLASESEDEFYIKLENIQCEVVTNYRKAVKNTFQNTSCFENFAMMHESFSQWAFDISQNGFFNCIDKMNELISNYTDMLNSISSNYNDYPSSVKEKIGYILNVFNIISNYQFLDNARSNEVIIPAYNPAMLEKIIARNDYIIYSFSELIDDDLQIKSSEISNIFSENSKLAAITQGVDVVPCGTEKLICKSVWGYYALYYGEKKTSYINNIELIPDANDSNAEISEQSNIIYHHIWNYMKTFPSRIDGLNISFISPTEIQYVVEGINKISDLLTKRKIYTNINLKVICFGGSKNIAGYLRYWLNNYMTKDKTVTIKTYLQYISNEKCETELSEILANQDLCFIYNILKTEDVVFCNYINNDSDNQALQIGCQFPMTFIPDTIAKTHGLKRQVNISQIQFLATKSYTQLANRVMNPNIIDGEYKVMQVLELQSLQNNILKIAHEQCRWVVCEDKAIDRDLLQADSRRIIGFTTGEGCFGEYNVTVSAKENVLNDVKKLLKQRLIGKFNNWSLSRAEASAEYCISLTEKFDGSRILKALNPYDYEIHNFLAYALTVKMLGIDKDDNDKYIVRSLLNLDSYQHWFRKTGTRPDFMLIEIPIDENIYNPNMVLNINIKIIECKMSINIDSHLEKASNQLEIGLDTFMNIWNPENSSISRRYWFTQLYRAIAFSVLSIDDGSVDYQVINSKIYNILNGKFNISWSGEIYAFDLIGTEEKIEEEKLASDFPIVLHRIGQLPIQRMLVPESDIDEFEYVEIDLYSEYEEEDDDIVETINSVYIPSLDRPVIDREYNMDLDESEDENSNQVEDEHIGMINTDISENYCEGTIENSFVEEPEDNIQIISGIEKTKDLSQVRILLGEDLKTKEKYYWEFGNPNLSNRHLLINGNSGCGKTYCIQGLLMETALQGVSSIVFDYTGGFTNSKLDPVFKNALGDKIKQRIIRVDKIPVNPFVKHEIQLDDDIFVPEEDVDVASKIAEIFSTVYSLGDQQKSAVYSAVLSGLSKYGEKMSFRLMVDELEALGTTYSKTVISKIQAFTDINPFSVDENFNWTDISNSDGTVYIVQLTGFGRDVQILLTEILLWDIWYFSVKNGDESKPIVLVLDEAQNLSHGEKSPSAKILTEGRKFGISGWYATQFMKPQLSDDEIQRLQQSAQKLYFCPPDDGVMAVAKNVDITPQGSKEWAEKLSKLKKGECVTCGSMMKNGKWIKYNPKILKVISLQERLIDE